MAVKIKKVKKYLHKNGLSVLYISVALRAGGRDEGQGKIPTR
jgi:hypothetical protein